MFIVRVQRVPETRFGYYVFFGDAGRLHMVCSPDSGVRAVLVRCEGYKAEVVNTFLDGTIRFPLDLLYANPTRLALNIFRIFDIRTEVLSWMK